MVRLGLANRCFLGVVLAVLLIGSLGVGISNAAPQGENRHPIDVARDWIDGLEPKLTPMLDEIPRDLAKSELVTASRKFDNLVVKLSVKRDNSLGPSTLAGWKFYWLKYICLDNYEVRLPGQGIVVTVTEAGKIDRTHYDWDWKSLPGKHYEWDWNRIPEGFSPPETWPRRPFGSTEINVTEEEAIEKTLEVARPIMEETGVQGYGSKASLYLQLLGGKYYPVWSVDIVYDNVYENPLGHTVSVYQTSIRTDTGEMCYACEAGPLMPPEVEFEGAPTPIAGAGAWTGSVRYERPMALIPSIAMAIIAVIASLSIFAVYRRGKPTRGAQGVNA